MIDVIIVWAVLPVIMAALVFYTAHPQTPRVRVGIVAFWCILVALATPYTLGRARLLPWELVPFSETWWYAAIFWGLVAVGAMSLLWAIVLIKSPAARPPVAPGNPGNYVPNSTTRTYRSQRRWM